MTKRLTALWQRLRDALNHPRFTQQPRWIRWTLRIAAVTIPVYLLWMTVCLFYWSSEPPLFDVVAATEQSNTQKVPDVTGYTYTATLIRIGGTLLDKPGGYLSNDRFPPGAFMDNMPNWEYGVLVTLRDGTKALRNDFSRSQSQSVEDKDLAIAEPQFNFQNDSWVLPSTEGEYRRGLEALNRYLVNLTRTDQPGAQFYARADNLVDYLAVVQKRLGNLSQRLSASVGQVRVNTGLAGDPAAKQSTAVSSTLAVKTPWMQIDDVFWEARGSCWALYEILSAINHDFDSVLRKKNAKPTLEQILRDLETTQQAITSPMILNGGGFGLTANYSLAMANYIAQANAAVIDLQHLLANG